MRYATIVIILGIITAIIPYLGFPFSWKKIIFVILGGLFFIIGILGKREYHKHTTPAKSKEKTGMAFKDSSTDEYTKVEITLPEEK